MPVTDDELLEDLRAVAAHLDKKSVGMKEYRLHGKHNDGTFHRRFGSWNNALIAAGLSVTKEVNIPDEKLFENILVLWQHYGRQPSKRDLARPPSSISERPYSRRFGSWWAALEAFSEYASSTDVPFVEPSSSRAPIKRSSRDPSLRQRWHVLQRDGFKCQACGASPAVSPGVELHIDHVIPWSKGGETTEENLQKLCSVCNLGKSNEAPGG